MRKLWTVSIIAAAVLCSGDLYASDGWKQPIDWAIGDTGAPDCPDWPAYATHYPACLLVDTPINRACLMRKAISSAKANDCDNTKWLVLTTQCHNEDAYNELQRVPLSDICAYLKTK